VELGIIGLSRDELQKLPAILEQLVEKHSPRHSMGREATGK